MPWVATNAEMTWRGVRVDAAAALRVAEAAARHLDALRPRLAAAGVADVRSHGQLTGYFRREGILELFRRGGGYSFDRGQLSALAGRHPSIGLIRAARRCEDVFREGLADGRYVGADGRVHPQYFHLGAHTGRQTSRWPNVLGLGRVFRPLVVPGPGRGIGEVDLAQVEIGIAAAVYGDDALVATFNADDAYSAMAKRFYADSLPAEDLRIPGEEFKRRHRGLRDRMKACTLGIVYGVTPRGLARQLGCGEPEARRLLVGFLDMFPALKVAQSEEAEYAAARGHATTAVGLRRYRAEGAGRATPWERNWMANYPVQGTAAALFKRACNRLRPLYRRHGAWLILAVHDAVVFEAPTPALAEVAGLTGRVLVESIEEAFPQLRPRFEANFGAPHCWNKDGHADSVDRWIEDPTYAI